MAKLLGSSQEKLEQIAEESDRLYREVPQKKKDGTLRLTYDAHPSLKVLQKSIVKKILQKVRFPHYLHGGIRDKANPRDQVSNASAHTRSTVLVLDDVADFFPSISSEHIFKMWCRLFNFPHSVSRILTKLTDKHGELPQGASTSSYIANLIFWDLEPTLVRELKVLGFSYTRFIDDITLSSRKKQSNKRVGKARSLVYAMLSKKSCRPKRPKSMVLKKGRSLNVTGLVVNGKNPKIDKEERKRIKAALRQLEFSTEATGNTLENNSEFRVVMGRVMRMVRLGHPDGISFKKRLLSLPLNAAGKNRKIK
ncbi:reverse transcriptase family protein [Halomonas sp. 18H]|nr:reverse transcriptase family protein [Halomonas sp. 18H]MCW4147924.1 reverse transcriptase family protein [Halomonas sp. 18H]